jgi:hypothetical protein
MVLQELSKGVFEECVGQTFVLSDGTGQSIEIVLSSVQSLSGSASVFSQAGSRPEKARRESFSLLFHAPRNWRVPQRIYRVTHPAIGEADIFLVPIGPDAKGMRLEAIFNFTS